MLKKKRMHAIGLITLAFTSLVSAAPSQEAYIKAPFPSGEDGFGRVAVHGDTMVVGFSNEDSIATGVNGNDNDDSGYQNGAAYVYTRDSNGGWVQDAYLKGSNTEISDGFGSSVAIYEDTIIVGAGSEDSNASGVNGNQSNNSAQNAGAAYVFVRDSSGNWSQQAYLKSPTTNANDHFSHNVDVAKDTAVASSWHRNEAYVYIRDASGNWSHEDTVAPNFSDYDDRFGWSVSLSEDSHLLAVGAPFEDGGSTGVNGGESDNSKSSSGAAYVFARDVAEGWIQTAYIKASNADSGDAFGGAVSLSGSRLAVAASEDSTAEGINGDQADNSGYKRGAVYIFDMDNNGLWEQSTYLKGIDSDNSDRFGTSIALDGDVLAVGASGEDSAAVGIDGDSSDNSVSNSGAVYILSVDNCGVWSHDHYVKSSYSASMSDYFGGRELALSGSVLAVGAHGEDSNASGINGDEANNLLGGSGAVYTFDLDL